MNFVTFQFVYKHKQIHFTLKEKEKYHYKKKILPGGMMQSGKR